MKVKTTCPFCGSEVETAVCPICGSETGIVEKESKKIYEQITGIEIYDQPIKSFFYTIIVTIISAILGYYLSGFIVKRLSAEEYETFVLEVKMLTVIVCVLFSYLLTSLLTYKTRLGKEAVKFGKNYSAYLIDKRKNEEEDGKVLTFRISTEDGPKDVIYRYRFKLGPFYTDRMFELYLYNDYIYVEDIFRTKEYYSKDRYR